MGKRTTRSKFGPSGALCPDFSLLIKSKYGKKTQQEIEAAENNGPLKENKWEKPPEQVQLHQPHGKINLTLRAITRAEAQKRTSTSRRLLEKHLSA